MCTNGLWPLSGVCSSHGICTAGGCVCDQFYSSHGDLMSYPDVECHIYEPFAIAIWSLVMLQSLLFSLRLGRLLFLDYFLRDFMSSPLSAQARIFLSHRVVFRLLLLWLSCTFLFVTCTLKFATIAQSGWRLSLEVQSIGHDLPITISAFLTFLFLYIWVPVHQIELVRSSVSLQEAVSDNHAASATEKLDSFILSSTSSAAVSSFLLFCGMFLPFLAPSAKIHSTATIVYFVGSMFLFFVIMISSLVSWRPLIDNIELLLPSINSDVPSTALSGGTLISAVTVVPLAHGGSMPDRQQRDTLASADAHPDTATHPDPDPDPEDAVTNKRSRRLSVSRLDLGREHIRQRAVLLRELNRAIVRDAVVGISMALAISVWPLLRAYSVYTLMLHGLMTCGACAVNLPLFPLHVQFEAE